MEETIHLLVPVSLEEPPPEALGTAGKGGSGKQQRQQQQEEGGGAQEGQAEGQAAPRPSAYLSPAIFEVGSGTAGAAGAAGGAAPAGQGGGRGGDAAHLTVRTAEGAARDTAVAVLRLRVSQRGRWGVMKRGIWVRKAGSRANS